MNLTHGVTVLCSRDLSMRSVVDMSSSVAMWFKDHALWAALRRPSAVVGDGVSDCFMDSTSHQESHVGLSMHMGGTRA